MLAFVTDTTVDLARSAARFGEGLFETIRIQAGSPRWITLHHDRLAAGCGALGLEAPPPLAELRASVAPLCEGLPSGALRLLAVDGELKAWAEPLGPEAPRPHTLGRAHTVQRAARSFGTRFKTLSYLDNRLLHREALARRLDAVVAANTAGRLTDTAHATLAVVLGDRLLTPPAAEGALPGIGRRILLEAGLLEEARLTWADLDRAEGAALLNALRGLRSVGHLEGLGPLDPAHPLLIRSAEVLEAALG